MSSEFIPSGALHYGRLEIVEALPHSSYAPEGGEELLRSLRGATLVKIGSFSEGGIEGGGLVLDYLPKGDDQVKRVVFAFTDSGLWVEWASPSSA